jgi:hypothetical protein
VGGGGGGRRWDYGADNERYCDNGLFGFIQCFLSRATFWVLPMLDCRRKGASIPPYESIRRPAMRSRRPLIEWECFQIPMAASSFARWMYSIAASVEYLMEGEPDAPQT